MKISEYESQSKNLQLDITSLQAEIDQAQKNIDSKEQEYSKESDLLDQRMIAVYENGQTSYLDFILSSNNLVDFISNFYLASEVASFDSELLDTIDKSRKEIEDQKNILETKKTQISSKIKDVETVNTKLKASQVQKNAKIASLSEDEKKTQADLAQFEQDKKEIDEQMRRLAAASKVTKSVGGYIFPLAGKSKSNITCGWYGYAGHTGVDVAISRGTQILAVKDGTVVISTALTGNIPNFDSSGKQIGSYRSYGEYIVIDHHDGTMSLYAHGYAGSRKVSVNQEVKQGQVIMNVGNTGNVRPRPSSSSTESGAHLHFGFYYKGALVNPTSYLP
ncbi:Murein hydrolase activator NlpD precursor [compost metagenome]